VKFSENTKKAPMQKLLINQPPISTINVQNLNVKNFYGQNSGDISCKDVLIQSIYFPLLEAVPSEIIIYNSIGIIRYIGI